MVLSREELTEIMNIANIYRPSWSWNFKTTDELKESEIYEALSTYAKGCNKDKIIGICSIRSEEGILLAEDALYSHYFVCGKIDKTLNYLPIYGISKITWINYNHLNVFYENRSVREKIYVNIFKDMINTLLTEIMKKETKNRTKTQVMPEWQSPEHVDYVLEPPYVLI